MDEIRELSRPLLAGLLAGFAAGMTTIDVLHWTHFGMGLIAFSLVLFSLISKNKIFTLCTAAASTAIIILDLMSLPVDREFQSVLALAERGLALCAIWLAVALRLLPTQAEKTLLALYGTVAICGHCNDLSDHPGDWATSEEFLRRRTSVTVTTTICRDCQEHWTPSFAMNSTFIGLFAGLLVRSGLIRYLPMQLLPGILAASQAHVHLTVHQRPDKP
jgi:hypothetical protein